MFGIVLLYCPICARAIRYNSDRETWKHRNFGVLCSRECWEKAERKYARMILGHDDNEES